MNSLPAVTLRNMTPAERERYAKLQGDDAQAAALARLDDALIVLDAMLSSDTDATPEAGAHD